MTTFNKVFTLFSKADLLMMRRLLENILTDFIHRCPGHKKWKLFAFTRWSVTLNLI